MNDTKYDVIIIGGSYAGLSAALTLGRSLRKVLIIDSWEPCGRKAPDSHNFLTNDGEKPSAIAFKARQEISFYETLRLIAGKAEKVIQKERCFEVITANAQIFTGQKILFATGLKDIMLDIPGFDQCWGTSIIHCPYCHGYEVYQERLAVFGNGDEGYEFAKLISNWSKDIALFTNGTPTFTYEQKQKLKKHGINIIQTKIEAIDCISNQVRTIKLKDGTEYAIQAIFARVPFEQSTNILQNLSCTFTKEGHIAIDESYATTIPGVYAAGDNSSRMRGVANAVAAGSMAGAFINKALIEEEF